ncbi:MAG: RDD family protein [Desulfobacterales bacterium]|nr:RDD family protein [Desulfobacterales bacterium]
MYCKQCGFHNAEGAIQCHICESDIPQQHDSKDQVNIVVDLMKTPLLSIIGSMKGLNIVTKVFSILIVSIVYLIKKIRRKPFLTPLMNSRLPKYQLIDLESMKSMHSRSLKSTESFLKQKGFQPFIDIESYHTVQGIIARTMVHPEFNVFAKIIILRATQKVSYVSFSAITLGNRYVEVDNTYGLPIDYPQNYTILFLPKTSLEKAYTVFLDILQQQKEIPLNIPLKPFLMHMSTVQKTSIEEGIRQGLFQIKSKGPDSLFRVSMCFYHPLRIATRKCSGCNIYVCDECYTAYQNQYFCNQCLPLHTQNQPIDADDSKLPVHYAGFAIRTLSGMIDWCIIASLTITIALLIRYFTQYSLPQSGLYIAVAQLFFVAFSIYYFTVPLYRYGQTTGQKLLGLHVVDQIGRKPDKISSIVRLSYHIFSCLFLLPMIGYVFVLFRKKKQGLHDQLASTYVITHRYVKTKAFAAWTFLILIPVAIGWMIYPYVMDFLPLYSDGIKEHISLQPKWVYPPDSSDNQYAISSFYIYDDRHCLVSTATSLSSLDMTSGKIVWTSTELAKSSIQTNSKKIHNSPVILLQSNDANLFLIRIVPETGQVLWKQQLRQMYANVVIDSENIAVYGGNILMLFDIDGKKRWEKTLDQPLQEEDGYVIFNKHLLMSSYTGTDTLLTYIQLETGDILWKQKNAFQPSYALGNGYQCVYTPDNKTMLMYLPDLKQMWDSPKNFYITGIDSTPSDSTQLPLYLYASKGIIKTQDGSIVFSYPMNSYLSCLTNNDIVLISSATTSCGSFTTPKRTAYLADKTNGQIKAKISENRWIHLGYLYEDETHIYLSGRIKTGRSLSTLLIAINKTTLESHEYPMGVLNLFPSGLKRITENLVFIATYKNVGTYVLAETADD